MLMEEGNIVEKTMYSFKKTPLKKHKAETLTSNPETTTEKHKSTELQKSKSPQIGEWADVIHILYTHVKLLYEQNRLCKLSYGHWKN